MVSFLKYPLAIIFAIAVTFSLFFLMQILISVDVDQFPQLSDRQVVDIHMPDYEYEIRNRIFKPERPKKPEQTPLQPSLTPLPDVQLDSVVDAIPFAVSPVGVNISPNIDSFGLGEEEGEYLPIVKVAPIYPYNALRSEIEGYVIVEFTVTKTGGVKDLRIVQAKPKRIFNRVAKEAVANFKYKPRIVGGQPVEVKGVQNKFTFKITR